MERQLHNLEKRKADLRHPRLSKGGSASLREFHERAAGTTCAAPALCHNFFNSARAGAATLFLLQARSASQEALREGGLQAEGPPPSSRAGRPGH